MRREVAVAIGVVEVLVAGVLFLAGHEPQARIALTLGLWILGRSLRSE